MNLPRTNQISEWIAERGMRSTLLGILANVGLSAAKISVGFVGPSFALAVLLLGPATLHAQAGVPDETRSKPFKTRQSQLRQC